MSRSRSNPLHLPKIGTDLRRKHRDAISIDKGYATEEELINFRERYNFTNYLEAVRESNLPSGVKHLLKELALRTNSDRPVMAPGRNNMPFDVFDGPNYLMAWPGKDTLARDLGVDVRTINRYILAAQEAGFVEYAVGGGKDTNIYALCFPGRVRWNWKTSAWASDKRPRDPSSGTSEEPNDHHNSGDTHDTVPSPKSDTHDTVPSPRGTDTHGTVSSPKSDIPDTHDTVPSPPWHRATRT